ncbi:hypothetical protein ABEB36_007303 [Hypothenemus hampei]|uniref:LEM domain-containing protein n=1 Tax=Hypothenemus hampei TaxID=57062 RepID=A0ABD1ETI7_HYPHA
MLYRGKDKNEFYLAAALYDSIEDRHLESVKSLLIEKGANPNLVLPLKGIAPFHLAIGYEPLEFALEVTNQILQNGGDPNVRSDEGITPVHIAAAWGRSAILDVLLKNGGDPQIRDEGGKTPFIYASEEGFRECLELLEKHRPNIDLISQVENHGNIDFVLEKILINNGVQIGEYQIAEDASVSEVSITKMDHFKSLPETDSTEYVSNWVFESQKNNCTDYNLINTNFDYENPSGFDCSDESLAESDCDNESKRYDSHCITFRKVYRKTRSKTKKPKTKSHNNTLYNDAETISRCTEVSKESGLMTLPSLSECTNDFNHSNELHSDLLNNPTTHLLSAKSDRQQEKSSDYYTCSHNSINSLNKNILEITKDLDRVSIKQKYQHGDSITEFEKNVFEISEGTTECSFITVSEVYKYVDRDEHVVLYEKRISKAISEQNNSMQSSNVSSLSLLPPLLDYDVETLRRELTLCGFNPGPITATTKRIYLKKLHSLKKHPIAPCPSNNKKREYSLELEKCLRNLEWCNDSRYKSLEVQLAQQFSNPDPSKKWREGNSKSSFTYLLLDPRLTDNLPQRADILQPIDIWQTFLSSIFYVGKGKRSRPYQHLYDSVDLWKKQQLTSSVKKLERILDIWKNGYGVICLHVFLNVIPVEAYSREAAMISAIKLENLTNVKSGEFYGITATWSKKEAQMLGVYLLHKAMMIFLQEGERQLCPMDIN